MVGTVSRTRATTLTAQNTFSAPISLRRGAVVTVTGTWSGTLSLQRYDKTSAAYVDVTNNSTSPTAVTWTGNGTFTIDPSMFQGLYRVGFKTGNFVSGSAVISLEGR